MRARRTNQQAYCWKGCYPHWLRLYFHQWLWEEDLPWKGISLHKHRQKCWIYVILQVHLTQIIPRIWNMATPVFNSIKPLMEEFAKKTGSEPWRSIWKRWISWRRFSHSFWRSGCLWTPIRHWRRIPLILFLTKISMGMLSLSFPHHELSHLRKFSNLHASFYSILLISRLWYFTPIKSWLYFWQLL